MKRKFKKIGKKNVSNTSCRMNKEHYTLIMILRSQAFLSPSQIHQQHQSILPFSLFSFIACLWKYMERKKKKCHSARPVSWDMKGLLFVLETWELYQGYSWTSVLSTFFLQDPVCLFQLSASTQKFHKTPANRINRYWISKQNLYFQVSLVNLLITKVLCFFKCLDSISHMGLMFNEFLGCLY